MSRFRKVDAGMWGDRRFASLSDDGKLLWVYLLTGPQVTSLPGVIVAGKPTIAEGLGWSVRRLTKALAELERTDGSTTDPMIKTDWKSRIVYLINGPRRNVPANPSVVRGWIEHWRCTPECDLKLEIEQMFRRVLANLPVSTKTGENEFLKEFDDVTGRRQEPTRPVRPPSDETPCSPPSSTPCSPPSSTPCSPPSLVRARAAPAPAPAPALSVSEGVQGEATPPVATRSGAASSVVPNVASPGRPSPGAPTPRPEGVPKGVIAMDRAAFNDAYVTAVRAVTGVPQWTMPPFGPRDLETLLANWCTGPERGDIEGWIARTVRAFADTEPTGYEPSRVIRYLNDRATTARKQVASVSAEASKQKFPPLEPDPDPEPMTPEERAQIESLLASHGMSEGRRQAREDDRNHVVPVIPRIAGVDTPPEAR